jgi:hypothetical protein
MQCAKFHNLTFLYKWDEEFDCISRKHEEEYRHIIKSHLSSSSTIKNGDIVFVGHTCETRQEYGFAIVKDGDFITSDDPPLGIVPDVYYKSAIQEVNVFWKDFCGGDDYYDENAIEFFKERGLYE